MKTTLILLVFLLSGAAHAGFDFAPIIASVAPAGQEATTSFTVTNSENVKLAVQVSIVPREPDLEGKEVYKETPAVNEMFRIFPKQLVLEPKQARTIRVTYVGTPEVKSELSFRIIAEELPVDLEDPNRKYTKAIAKISLSTRYIGSLYVTPKGAKSEIVVEASKSPTNQLILNVSNKGTAHQIYRKPVVKVFNQKTQKELILGDEDIKPLMSQNILAGRSRRYTLPWPKELAAGPIKVMLEAKE